MRNFDLIKEELCGIKILKRNSFQDNRGLFSKLFDIEQLESIGWKGSVCQVNASQTFAAGAIRGMHYQQAPNHEMKLVHCIKGRIYDVVVDLRRKSQTFMQWFGYELSEDGQTTILIPEGFAHGFQALENNVELIYVHNKKYLPSTELGINPLDRLLDINWPQAVTSISDKDNNRIFINADFVGLDDEM